MDNIIFNQPGGFPLYTDTLDAMQRMYQPFLNGLGSMAGNRAIISGCDEIGDKITNGIIQIDNEIFELKEGIKQEFITIKEESKSYEFENGENKTTIIYRYAVFGTGTKSYKWSDFKRVIPLNTIQEILNNKVNNDRLEILERKVNHQEKLLAPLNSGFGVFGWTGPKELIPAGFIIVGEYINKVLRGSDIAGQEGGKDSHTITTSQIPSITGTVDIIHPYEGTPIGGGFKGGNNKFRSLRQNINNSGGGQPIPTIPYYRSIILLKWVG